MTDEEFSYGFRVVLTLMLICAVAINTVVALFCFMGNDLSNAAKVFAYNLFCLPGFYFNRDILKAMFKAK